MSEFNYPRIFARVFMETWALDQAVYLSIQEVLLARINGEPGPQTFQAFGGSGGSAGGNSRLVRTGKLTTINVKGIMSPGLSTMEKMCGGYDTRALEQDIEQAKADDSKRVLFRIDSPGGNTQGVLEGGQMIRELGKVKPTYSVSEGDMCSAAMWWGSQAGRVYVTPTARAGSIGVYSAMLDRTKEMEMKGQKLELFKAGEHKAMGFPGTTLSDKDKALMQSYVDDSYREFTKAVTSARPQVSKEAMQGQFFKGRKAVKAGLADGVVNSVSALVNALSI